MEETEISYLAKMLYQNKIEKKKSEKIATTLEVLSLIGMGSLLICSFLAPGSARLLKIFKPSNKEWGKFNKSYLLKSLRQLRKEKLVEISKGENDSWTVQITTNGKRRILKSSLENLGIPKPLKWNGYWYFVSYDVPTGYNYLRDNIRKHLEKLGFYRFQKSLYLYPFPCEREIEFLKELLGVSEYVRVIKANYIENDGVFRKYFGI